MSFPRGCSCITFPEKQTSNGPRSQSIATPPLLAHTTHHTPHTTPHTTPHHVVPADPALWPVDPFAGIVREDTIYGRGALDDKGGLVPALFAMAAIREAKTVPRREPVLVIGMDEETDWFGIRDRKSVV